MKRFLSISAVSAAVLGFAAAPAFATPTMNPTNRNFGGVTVGSQSAPFPFVVNQVCMPDPMMIVPCLPEPPLTMSPSTTGDFVITSEDCPPVLGPPVMPGGGPSCSINVAFRPTASGSRTGQVSSGGGGPAAALSGFGLDAPVSTPTPPATPTTTPDTPSKKCKKKKGKKGAVAAKKCKKKGKGKGK